MIEEATKQLEYEAALDKAEMWRRLLSNIEGADLPTLRDVFAAFALAGLVSDVYLEVVDDMETARTAYALADAMLQARRPAR
jgi:hypothetical protein